MILDNSYFSSIFEDCCWITNSFEFIIFSYVCREDNRKVYGLVELVQIFSFHVLMFWLDDVHVIIPPLVVSDILEQ